MKAAVVGVGSMGKNHARVYSELGALVGVCDTRGEVASDIGARHGCFATNSIKSLLRSTKPDVVSIAVPTPLHYKVAKECLEAGVHVMIEKPITSTVAEATDLIKIAADHGLQLTVGYIEQFNPAVRALHNKVDAAVFGDITSVNIKRVGGIPRSASHIITDLMTHDFNILLSLFKHNPTHVYSHVTGRNGIIDSAQVLLDFRTGSATCESNWISPIKVRRIEVTGTSACATVDLIAQTVTEIQADCEITRKYQGEPLKLELKSFLDAIEKGTEPVVSGRDARSTLRLNSRATEAVR